MNGLCSFTASFFLDDDPHMEFKSSTRCIKIGSGMHRIDLYLDNIKQAQKLRDTVDKALASLIELQNASEIIEQQQARITALEQEIAARATAPVADGTVA